MHDVPLHTCEPLHVAHALPEVPHAPEVVPGMHTFPLQQPVGHEVALHAKTHWPDAHVWFPEHALQALPPPPHALVLEPGMHTFPMQHPLGHVVALQVDAVMHWPEEHVWFPEHVLHALPPAPQALVAVPGRHTLPEQQPLGHVVTLQVEPPLHWPELQVCPPEHALHALPPAPHALVAVPGKHTLP